MLLRLLSTASWSETRTPRLSAGDPISYPPEPRVVLPIEQLLIRWTERRPIWGEGGWIILLIRGSLQEQQVLAADTIFEREAVPVTTRWSHKIVWHLGIVVVVSLTRDAVEAKSA